jgi:hypothetical protein
MMRTPTNYWASEARGFHYCKLLSPFRAVEWIYIDALYDRGGIKEFDLEVTGDDECFEWNNQMWTGVARNEDPFFTECGLEECLRCDY